MGCDIKYHLRLIESLETGELRLIDIGITKVVVGNLLDKGIIDKILLFAEENEYDIRHSFKRDNCGVVASSFSLYMGDSCERKEGFIYCPNYYNFSKKDLLKKEIDDMIQDGYNINNKEDIREYVLSNNLLNELQHIPHYWNVVDGFIVDFSVYEQCIRNGYIEKITTNNYRKSIQ